MPEYSLSIIFFLIYDPVIHKYLLPEAAFISANCRQFYYQNALTRLRRIADQQKHLTLTGGFLQCRTGMIGATGRLFASRPVESVTVNLL